MPQDSQLRRLLLSSAGRVRVPFLIYIISLSSVLNNITKAVKKKYGEGSLSVFINEFPYCGGKISLLPHVDDEFRYKFTHNSTLITWQPFL